MEHFNRTNPKAWESSRASSMISIDSLKKPAYSEYAESTTSTGSKPISIPPSYMNAIPARKPVTPKLNASTQPVELPTATSPPSVPPPMKGLLILAVAAAPHPSTVSHLEIMLKRGSYAGIIMLGHEDQEAELKQLKMSAYALLGKMSQEAGIQLELQKDWTEVLISAAISKAVKSGDPINGVLCTPAHEGNRSVGSDILALDEEALQHPWKFSAGFLQSVAKAVVPSMLSSSHISRGLSRSFLVSGPTTRSPICSVYRAACDSIITLIANATAGKGVVVAYAENVIIPDPEPPKSNGSIHLSAKAGPIDPDISDFAPGESPTKLWNMWALQDELAAND